MIELEPAIRSLVENQVEFVIVGGVAITAHGSAYITKDLDFCYSRAKENLFHLVAALAPFKPRPRDFPAGLPFVWDAGTLRNSTNFTLSTDIGDIDLLGEVSGVGAYADAAADCVVMQLYGHNVQVLSLDALIRAKRAAGRTKDLLVLPELEALREVLSKETE